METVQLHENLSYVQTIEVESSRPPSTNDAALQSDAVAFIPIGFLLLWTLAAWVFLDVPKLAREYKLLLRKGEQVPCRNCQFFTNNPYLKCAVRPHAALTQEANTCPDYAPHPKPTK